MKLGATGGVLLLVVFGSAFAIPARADSIPTDTFVLDSFFQATFTMPAAIPGNADGASYSLPLTVTAAGVTETLNYTITFNSLASSPQSFYMNCFDFTDPADFCFVRNILGFSVDPFTYANGVITFLPGIYSAPGGSLTISDPPAVPEPGALVLLAIGFAGILVIQARR